MKEIVWSGEELARPLTAWRCPSCAPLLSPGWGWQAQPHPSSLTTIRLPGPRAAQGAKFEEREIRADLKEIAEKYHTKMVELVVEQAR